MGLGPIRVSAGTRGIYGSVGAGPVRVGGRLAGSSRRGGSTVTGFANTTATNAEYQRRVREYHRALIREWADRIYAGNLKGVDVRQIMAWTEESAFVRNAALAGQIANQDGTVADDTTWSHFAWWEKVNALESAMRKALADDFDLDRSPTEGRRLYGARAWLWFTKSGRTKRRPYLHLW